MSGEEGMRWGAEHIGCMLGGMAFVAAVLGWSQIVSRPAVTVFVDPDTRCEYLVANETVPRMAADGKTHAGCKGQ